MSLSAHNAPDFDASSKNSKMRHIPVYLSHPKMAARLVLADSFVVLGTEVTND